MALPEVKEWLRDQGHMGYEEFIDWVRELAEEVNDKGIPAGLDRGRAELRDFLEELVEEVRRSNELKDLLLPKPEHKVSKEEAQKTLFKRQSLAWQLSQELRNEYLHREAVIVNTSKQLFNLGETTGYMDIMDIRRLVEKNAAAEGVGVY
jgi:hypothetical protein